MEPTLSGHQFIHVDGTALIVEQLDCLSLIVADIITMPVLRYQREQIPYEIVVREFESIRGSELVESLFDQAFYILRAVHHLGPITIAHQYQCT